MRMGAWAHGPWHACYSFTPGACLLLGRTVCVHLACPDELSSQVVHLLEVVRSKGGLVKGKAQQRHVLHVLVNVLLPDVSRVRVVVAQDACALNEAVGQGGDACVAAGAAADVA